MVVGKREEELRKMFVSTLTKVRDDLTKHVKEQNETDASYALRQIEHNFQATELAGDPKKPWAGMSTMEMQRELALWCLESVLK